MTDWDARYRSQDTPWDLGGPSPVVLDAVAHSLAPHSRLLVPGCGRGWNVEALAALGHEVLGLDLSPTAVASAQSRTAGLAGADFQVGDFLSAPASLHGAFDGIVEHTCFCALEPSKREAYLSAAVQCLRPRGVLAGAFLHFSGGGPPHGTDPNALARLVEPYFEVLEMANAEAFPPKGCRQLRVVLRRLD